MTYQNKPLYRPSGGDLDGIKNTIHDVLLAATETGCKAVGCTGASFVTSSIGIWMQELAEIDGKLTAKFFAALAVLADPSASHNQKVAAEKKRRSAMEKLMQSVNLDMAVDGEPKH